MYNILLKFKMVLFFSFSGITVLNNIRLLIIQNHLSIA